MADWEIENAKLWNPNLTRDERTLISYEVVNLQAESPIMLHHLFISYNHGDTAFVEKLENRAVRTRRGDVRGRRPAAAQAPVTAQGQLGRVGGGGRLLPMVDPGCHHFRHHRPGGRRVCLL